MRSVLGLVVVCYVYIAGPAICLAGTDIHACGCSEAACPECPTHPSRTAHECHDDPCPDVSRPPEQDEVSLPEPSAQCPDAAAAIDLASGAQGLSVLYVSSPPSAAPRSDSFAARGLPLLI